MKRIILLLCILGSALLTLSAQEAYVTERGTIKGAKSTYLITEVIRGKEHFLRYVSLKDSLRWIKYDWPTHRFSLPKLGNKYKLDSLTEVYILPFLKKNNLLQIPVTCGVKAGLASDNTGIVSEVLFITPVEWKFPIEIIENYMEAIKKEKLKFDFHVSPEFLKEVPRFGGIYGYSPNTLKEMLQETN